MNLVKTTLHNDTQINFGNIEPVTTHMNTKTCVDVQRRFFIVDDIRPPQKLTYTACHNLLAICVVFLLGVRQHAFVVILAYR